MKKIFFYFTLILFLGLFSSAYSQDFFRIETDFTMKSKSPDGQSHLTIGKVYYDKNIKKLVYKVKFPKKEIWVQKDTTLFKIVDKKIVSKQSSLNIAEMTIFHLALNGKLSDYGLKNSTMSLVDVEKEGNNVFSTWEPPRAYKDVMGKIIIQKTDQKITGVIFMDPNDKIINRQFFLKYKNVDGLEFPTEIIVENIVAGEKFYNVTNYENIIINNYKNKDMYNYKVLDDE